nr:tetraacyldisaccharide 4'-kinase [candidate division Zixibacteria bacterium]
MEKLWLTIINNKNKPGYWPAVFILWLVSILYNIGVHVRRIFSPAPARISIPVISIGNITVGGSGKTPMVIRLAEYFRSRNKKVGIISSGYGRRSKKNIDGTGQEIASLAVDLTGDEVLMMAETLPDIYFTVAKSKYEAAGRMDEKYHPDIILVDDGYQHHRLGRDFDLLIIDSGIDLRKEHIFPLGRLRESIHALERAQGAVLTKGNISTAAPGYVDWIRGNFPGKPVAEVEFVNESIVAGGKRIPIDETTGQSVYFFAGIGGFSTLLNYVRSMYGNIAEQRQFPDHCCYSPETVAELTKDIDKINPDLVLTTHKDYVKIRNFDFGRIVYYLDLQLRFISGEQDLLEKLDQVVKK